ncbi:hypothetical protein V1L65_04750 [Paenibacillus sp. IITD108]
MDEQHPITLEIEAEKNPYSYLLSIPAEDSRWEKFKCFWQLESLDPDWISNTRMRKLRSKQILLAILNDQYCKSNIEITVDHQERIITFRYRDTIIGQFHQRIISFIPVYADVYEASYSTIGQRKIAKSAIEEISKAIFGDPAAARISSAYKEFLVLLFSAVPRQPSDLWVSREAYVNAMNVIEEKYKLEPGDTNFLEWRLTLLGRSPRLIDDEGRK